MQFGRLMLYKNTIQATKMEARAAAAMVGAKKVKEMIKQKGR